MLQELAARTGAAPWVVGAMLFFIGVWLAITVWVFRARREEMDAHARLALEGDPPSRDALRRAGPVSREALRRASTVADDQEGLDRHDRRPSISES